MLSQKLTRLNIKSLRNVLGSTCCYCSGDKKQPTWRVPTMEQPGEWYSKLSVFQTGRGPDTNWFTIIQSEFDLRPSTIKRWWKNLREKQTIFEERFIPERHKILGGDLAAAHFIVHRGGAVRFYGKNEWVRQNEDEEYDLPRFFNPDYCIEAIDASKMEIHFEGLVNLLDLYRIKWLSFEGCPNIDDWCLDRISGAFPDCLEYLDLRNCPKVTARGLATLYRSRKLEKLLVSNDSGDQSFDVVCLMLEDLFPKLQIEGIEYIPLPGDADNPGIESSESKKSSSMK